MTRAPVAIVGGGVAGLATALTLQQRDIDAVVFEQAPALTEVGAGFMLSPNATRLLAGLGVLDDLMPAAVEPAAMTLRSWADGATIKRQVMGSRSVELFGAPQLAVHRAAVVEILAGALSPGSLHLGKRFDGLVQEAGSARLAFADGTAVDASAVIGADGFRSPVAAALGVATHPEQSAYACFRALVPAEDLPNGSMDPDWTVWLGPQQHLVHYPISSGRFLNVVAFVPLPAEAESWTTQGDPDVLREFFTGWHPAVRAVLDPIEHVTVWGLYERRAREHWSRGNAVVIGDAAHPMLPFFAQGAAQAIEDAALLGHLLPDALRDGRTAEAFERFCAERLDRVRRIQGIALDNATVFHLPDGVEQRERDQRFADANSPDAFTNNGWVFRHDVLAS